MLKHLLLLATGAKAGQQLDADGIIGHALAKGVEMLLRQNGRRHQHRDLPAAHDSLEGGPDRHLGFAVANVPANQTVHRFGSFHVRFGLNNGTHLIGGFLEKKGALKLALPGRIGPETGALLGFARRLNLQQFGSQIAHRPLGMLFGFGPTPASQSIEGWTRFARPHVFADQIGLADRDVKLWRSLIGIIGRIFNSQTFLQPRISGLAFLERFLPGCGGQHGQAQIAPDAMVEMDHVIAFLQIRKIDIQQRARSLGVGRFESAWTLDFVTAENLRIGDDDQPGQFAEKAARQCAEVEGGTYGNGGRGWRLGQAILFPNFLEALALPFIVAKDMDGITLAQPAMQLIEESASLLFGHLRVRRSPAQWAKSIQALELQARIPAPP